MRTNLTILNRSRADACPPRRTANLKTRLLAGGVVLLASLAAQAQWTNYVEMEDYNFEGGNFISGATNGMNGPYNVGAYKDKVATADVDLHIVVAHNADNTSPYRSADYHNLGLYTSTQVKQVYPDNLDTDRGYFGVTNNWKMSWQEAGEWQNYTRIFSNAVYSVTFRGAHNTSRIKMELALVTSDPTQPGQTTDPIGFTDAPPTDPADVNHFKLIPVIDGLGLPLQYRLSGTNTLRMTQRANSNLDWLRFTAMADVAVMPPYVLSAAPAPGAVLSALAPINVSIRQGDNPVDTNKIRLSVNGADVSAKATITATAAGGATVFYDYNGTIPVSSPTDVQLIYGDNGSPATMVTNNWTFTAPPGWPIVFSTTAVSLPENSTTNISVRIPLGFNATSQVEVDIETYDASVAEPLGGSGGVLALYFPIGGTNVQNFTLQTHATGTVQIVTFSPDALLQTTLNVTVFNAMPGIDVQPVSQSAYSGNTVHFSVAASGLGTLTYQWQAGAVGAGVFTNLVNGGNISGATNATLTVSSVPLANVDYQVVVSNESGSVTSAPPATLTVSTSPPTPVGVTPAALQQPLGYRFSLAVTEVGSLPMTYQWLHNGAPMADDARVSGSHSDVLTIACALAGDAGTYKLLMTNGFGDNVTSDATVTVVPKLGFSDGSAWTLNGGATLASEELTLTDGVGGEARSAFFNGPVSADGFIASFTYQDVTGVGADGAAFILQNSSSGPSALGGGGGGVGYLGISPSAALIFNIYGTAGMAVKTGGVTGGYAVTTPLNLASADPIGVVVRYAAGTMSVTLTDAVASVSFTTNYAVNVASAVGGHTAYVGFSGGTGAVFSRQQISNFAFATIPALSSQLTGNSLLLCWPMTATGFELQRKADLNATGWDPVTNAVNVVGGQYQVIVPLPAGNQFYRLMSH